MLIKTLFFLTLQHLLLSINTHSTQSHNLLLFKSSLQNPNLLPNWSPNNNPCNFTGIKCINSTISSINLTNINLTSNFTSISSTLLTLPTLKSFTAKNSNIIGNITIMPSLISKHLTLLDLTNNRITGFVDDIITSLSLCPNLKTLILSQNLIEMSDLTRPVALTLKVIELANNRLSGPGFLPWILSVGCDDLIVFNVSGNNISGVVPESFKSCMLLEVVDLSRNNVSGELRVDLFRGLSRLKVLNLGFNNFVGELSDSVSDMMSLERFDVSSNRISGRIPEGICISSNGSRTRLEVLYLQNNMFNGSVPVSVGNCSQLVSLDLSFNSLTGTIPVSFRYLSKLKDLIIWMNLLSGEIPEELRYVKRLENLILDFNYLTGSIPASLSNCTNLNWISLSNNRLSGGIPAALGGLSNLAILKLGNNSFSGRIPAELGDCKSLVWLDLNTNELSGSIPPDLFKQSGYIAAAYLTGKPYLYIKNDGSVQCHGAGNLLEFGGIRQVDLDRISSRHPCNFTRVYLGNTQPNFNHNGSMIFLDLSYNKLEGGIPKELGSMYYLNILNLGHNDLTGPIPDELSGLKNAGILDLSHNRLNGSIPNSLSGLSLVDADLSYNNLSGFIPVSAPFDTFPPERFSNNPGLCGYPLPKCVSDPQDILNSHRKPNKREVSLAGSVAMGLLFSLFCTIGVVVILVEIRKKRKKAAAALEEYTDRDGNSYSGGGRAFTSTAWKLMSPAEAYSISLAAFEKPLRKLTFADLLEATNGFDNNSLIGSGGFGDVYRAQLKDNTVVAIKKLIHVSDQGDREFTAEMETIGKVKHRNLVSLLGYCKVGDERLLVYEYMKFGSLEDVLHDRKKTGIKLNWAARKNIAIGSARGLAFLHRSCNPHIIHRDMKSSNVLLDENLEARVSDFGMARHMSVMDTHLSVSTLAGTPGYVPPEYYQSFKCTTRGDVYSYGVVLLELLTGKQPTDSPDFGDNNLVGWVKQHPRTHITDVFDRELLNEDPTLTEELIQYLKVAYACLDDRPGKRPTMVQVMAMFEKIQAGSGLDSASTIASGKARFSTVEEVEMTRKEDSEESKH